MSQFILKMIAAFTMLIDHAGLILFPGNDIFRIIGRLAFPIYAYCIAEGFLYTRNRLKYFLRIFILGAACQLVYDIVERDIYIGILLTFSMSVILMYLASGAQSALFGDGSSLCKIIEKIIRKNIPLVADKIISLTMLLLGITAVYVLCYYVEVDYGFIGVMLPVFTSLFRDRTRRFFMFTAGLIALCIHFAYFGNTIQLFSLFTVPIIAMYNGNPGKYRLKYFFYVFYPLHLGILYLIDTII